MPDSLLLRLLREEAFERYKLRRYARPDMQKKVAGFRSISIVTTCMDRKCDVAETLPQNMKDNEKYPGPLEFLLLDYNSRDGLGEWVKDNMIDNILSGRLTYYRMEEPEHYSMAHSRNVAFRLAQGEIVLNVDADNFTNEGFASFINLCASQFPERAAFVKGKQLLRGRVGFYKKEFVDLLGGYDEDLRGYGADDIDIVTRALALGFTGVCHGGEFVSWVDGHEKHAAMSRYEDDDWRYTQRRNTLLSMFNVEAGRLKANKNRHWGRAVLGRNFVEEVRI